MTRLSIDLSGPKISVVFRCDRCLRTTDAHTMRLRPQRPIPRVGPVLHECADCVRMSRERTAAPEARSSATMEQTGLAGTSTVPGALPKSE